ncbi:MAG: hypothetical protein KF778_22485 [Rhodocyclaceae bacterium]|nr:hypothetical protein [Rhodocyclaceae bacterium]
MKTLVTKRRALTTSMLAALLFPAVPLWAQHAEQHAVAAQAPAANKVAHSDGVMRDLWVDHIFWVRNVVIDTLAGNKMAAAVAEQQVVANAKQIAAAIEPYYGKAASEELFRLLAGHYDAVKHYVAATAAGSKDKQAAAVDSLTGNATAIAKFLSSANPNLPFDTVNGLLVAHGGHHIRQTQQLRGKQYAEEAQTWEAMKQHMYVIADALVGAIEKQFPNRFG